MGTVLYARDADEGQQQPGRGLSTIFSRKKSKAANIVFEAEQDALDAFHSAADSRGGLIQGEPLAAATTRAAQPGHWGGAAGRWSSSTVQRTADPVEEAAEITAAEAAVAEEELGRLRAECARQGQQLAATQKQLRGSQAAVREAQGVLNMQRFKYELLLDLWSMRVLDNEELGLLQGDPTAAGGRH